MRHLKLALALAAFITSCSEKQTLVHSSANFELVELSKGVYGCIHKFGGKAICNVGIIDNGKETLIFDSFLSPSVASELLDVVEGLGLSPIKYVVNSHSHNDHIRGNQVFSSDVKIISTSKTAELIKEWEPIDIEDEKEYAPQRLAHYDSLCKAYNGDTTAREYLQILMWRPYYEALAESHKVVKTRLPDVFVDHQQYYNGPARRVQLISKGQGHTESDLILYLPDDKILFAGDLVFNECHPYLPSGFVPDWLNWLNFMDSLNVGIVVPGHGKTGSKDIIPAMRTYILSIENLVEEMHYRDLTIDDAEKIEIPDQYKDWWFDRFFLSNLKFMYSGMDKK
ncbi:MAG: MBL fold metallo-hydrolase [Cyclobacteriaceae bacterium]|nr:MBL fold metallo-hydrolase [Cyclobacteriaceae bacterium]